MIHLRTLVAALAVGALGATATLAAVTSASVTKLTVGTSTDVQGTDFARPVQAWIELGERRIPLRIARGATSTAFTAKLAAIPAGAHGACVLRVKGKGSRVPFTLAGLSIELPQASAVAPARGGAGDEITIDGAWFGSKKGRVRIGTRTARVRSWSDTRVVAVLPRNVVPGAVFVTVENRAGASPTQPVLMVE